MKKFVAFTTILAVSANVAIISCNRQADTKQGEDAMQHSEGMPLDHTAIQSMQKDTVNPYVNASVEVTTFANDPALGGYGYDIVIDGKTYIHQTNIPAVPGNTGFSSEEKARKAANLMVYKIRNNILPPALDEKELDSLGVL